MCGVVGGILLKGAENYTDSDYSVDYEIIRSLFKSSGNRGHESVGIYLESLNNVEFIKKDLGTVSDFFGNHGKDINNFMENSDIKNFIGHIRYATSSGAKTQGKGQERNNIHPIFVSSENYRLIIIENGQTCFDADEMDNECTGNFMGKGMLNRNGATNDTSFKGMNILDFLERSSEKGLQKSFNNNLVDCLSNLYDETFDNGMFSALGLIHDKSSGDSLFFVMRDGGHPLYQFDLDGYRFFCSESSYIADLKQNLLVELDTKNIREYPAGLIQIYDCNTNSLIEISKKQKKQPCFFEYVYMMKENTQVSDIYGSLVRVKDIRAELGIQALLEHEEILDLLLYDEDAILSSVPYSGLSYTKKMKDRFWIDDSNVIKRNKNDDFRTFIASDDPLARFKKANSKFSISSDVDGKKVVMLDDSLVRNTVAAVLNKKLRMMGATEVYYLSGTPPVTSPCYGGINTYRKDLAVTQIEETRGINAVDIGNDYYGTGAHKQFEEALMYFEHEPVIMEKLGGPIITDGVGFLSIYGLNKVLDMFNLQQSAQCCVTGKYPYKFRGIKGHGSFVPTAGYRDAIRNNAISPVKI